MRTDQVFRLILNVKLVAGLPSKLRDDKYVDLVACENPPELTKFLFKFGNRDAAEVFAESLESILAE